MIWIRATGALVPAVLWAGHLWPVRDARIPLTFTLATPSVVGGNGVAATITLGVAAPTGGTIVTVTNPLGTTVQAGVHQSGIIQSQGSTKITVDPGARMVVFNILAAGVAATSVATLTATSGTDEAAVALVINPAAPRTVIVTPAVITGGQPASVTILLDGAAPGAGVDIPLTTLAQNPAQIGDGSVRLVSPAFGASVPATVHFTPGASSITVPIPTTAVAFDQKLSITAAFGAGSATASLTIKPPVVAAVQLAPATVVLGNGTTGTVSLNGPAPANGFNIGLSSTNASATVPLNVTVPAGASSVTFPIATGVPNTRAGSGGSSAGSGATLSVVIGAGPIGRASPGSFTDGTSNTVLIGETPHPVASATLTILPVVVLQSTGVAPSFVNGGDPITLSITLTTGPIAIQSGSGSVAFGSATSAIAGTAKITVDQPALVQLPTTVTIPSGSGVVTVKGAASAVTADATVTISTTFGEKTTSTTLLVKAPVLALESFSARPTTVTGGNNLLASFKLFSSITSATVVTLSTDRPDLIQLPASVTVPVALVPTPFTFKTQAVSVQTTATITAVAGTQKVATTISIVP